MVAFVPRSRGAPVPPMPEIVGTRLFGCRLPVGPTIPPTPDPPGQGRPGSASRCVAARPGRVRTAPGSSRDPGPQLRPRTGEDLLVVIITSCRHITVIPARHRHPGECRDLSPVGLRSCGRATAGSSCDPGPQLRPRTGVDYWWSSLRPAGTSPSCRHTTVIPAHHRPPGTPPSSRRMPGSQPVGRRLSALHRHPGECRDLGSGLEDAYGPEPGSHSVHRHPGRAATSRARRATGRPGSEKVGTCVG